VGAVFGVDGFFYFNGVRVGLDFDFGLGEACFTFVGYDHFHEGFFRMARHPGRFEVPRERMHEFYGRSVIRNEFRRDEHGRFVNNGIGRDRMERVTHGRVEHSSFEERKPVGDRNRLAAQRADEARKQVGKPGEQGHEQIEKPGGERTTQTASVSKVFRPPTQTQKANTGQQKQSQSQQQKEKK
jgi:hypothetical protein